MEIKCPVADTYGKSQSFVYVLVIMHCNSNVSLERINNKKLNPEKMIFQHQ